MLFAALTLTVELAREDPGRMVNYEPSGVVCIIDAPLPTAAMKVN